MNDHRTPPSRQDKAAERDYYEKLFSTRRSFNQFQTAIYERVAAEARKGAQGNRALDIGCGSGTQAVCLIERGFDVVTLDLSLEAVKLARAAVTGAGATVRAANADAELLPIRDASVDACVCGLLLHHFPTLDGVAAELRRVVRPGGVVVAIDANGHNPFAWLFFNVVHRYYGLPHLTPNQRALRRSEIRKVFSRFGFGDFAFDSMTSDLKRDWLGGSLAAQMNFYARRAVLRLSDLAMPSICRGNMLLGTFRRLPEES